MNIQNQARQETAAKRQQEKHTRDTMSTRAEAEVKQATSEIEAQTREGETTTRQQEERLRENMSSRSQAEISDR